jgi:alpha-N-acetylglucosamine transferase
MQVEDDGLGTKTRSPNPTVRIKWRTVQSGKYAPLIQYKQMYTKLHVFNQSDRFDSIIYMDTDQIVKGSLRNLFELVVDTPDVPAPFEFAAGADCWPESFDVLFNAGFFVLRPRSDKFAMWMLNQGSSEDYDGLMAEQNFLNAHFKYTRGLLPARYGMNLVMDWNYWKQRPNWELECICG